MTKPLPNPVQSVARLLSCLVGVCVCLCNVTVYVATCARSHRTNSGSCVATDFAAAMSKSMLFSDQDDDQVWLEYGIIFSMLVHRSSSYCINLNVYTRMVNGLILVSACKSQVQKCLFCHLLDTYSLMLLVVLLLSLLLLLLFHVARNFRPIFTKYSPSFASSSVGRR